MFKIKYLSLYLVWLYVTGECPGMYLAKSLCSDSRLAINIFLMHDAIVCDNLKSELLFQFNLDQVCGYSS